MLSSERLSNYERRDGCGLTKLQDAIYKSKDDCKSRYEVELLNRYRNVISKSFSESPISPNDKSRSPLSRRKQAKTFTPRRNKSSSQSTFELTPSPIRNFSTPKDEENREKINYHLKRIQEQIEGDRHKWKNRSNEMKNLSDDMKTIKEEIAHTRLFKSPPKLISPTIPKSHEKLDAYKKKIEKQKVAIHLLTEQLELKEKEAGKTKAVLQEADLNNNRLKLFEEQVRREENERMKLMKEHTDVQQRLQEADRERSELLFALSDVKAEARSILLAYEEASHSLPELKSLLEVSAKQKSEFSEQLVILNKELDERKSEVVELESGIREYSALVNTKDSEKQVLTKKLEESRSKYDAVQKELTTADQNLVETRQLLNEYTESNKHLKDKVVSTLKAYRSRCQKYEDKFRTFEEDNKLKETDLTKAISHSKELQFENLKQKEELRDLSCRMEDLQQNITLYVNKCQQVSEEKNNLEVSLLQSNERNNEYCAIQNELLQTKDENSRIKSELHDEKQKLFEYEALVKKYYENNLSLKEENATLQLAVEKETTLTQEERGKHTETFSKLKEDYKLVTRSNEEFVEKLRTSMENTNLMKMKCENSKSTLEEQRAQTNKESLKSKALIRKLRTLSNENLLLRNEYQMEKETLEQKLSSFESSARDNKQRHTVLLKHIENAKMDTSIGEDNFKIVIEIITKDIDNLLKLLCNEEENVTPPKTIPQCSMQGEVDGLREKLQSCFTVTGTLKHGYNKLRLLNRKGRETIKSQTKDIHHLHSSNKNDILKYQQQIAELEKTQEQNEDGISKLENDNQNLRNRVCDQVKDLEECVTAVRDSVEDLKDEKYEYNVLESSNYNEEKRMKNNENISRITEQVEKLRTQLTSAKQDFNDVGEDAMNNNEASGNYTLPLASSTPFADNNVLTQDARVRTVSLNNSSPRIETSISACSLNSANDVKETNSDILLVR